MGWLNTNAGAIQAIATIVLVLVTAGYVVLTDRIAKASEASAEAGRRASEAARASAAAAEGALLAEAMPFVRPSFGATETDDVPESFGPGAWIAAVNEGRHAAVNVDISIGGDLVHTFPIITAGESESCKWPHNDPQGWTDRFRAAKDSGWVLSARYSDPYGHRYEVEVQRIEAGGRKREERVSTYQLDEDGSRMRTLAVRKP